MDSSHNFNIPLIYLGSEPGYIHFKRVCENPDLFNGKVAERSGCRNKCDTDRNCVSFGWEKTKKTCHVSSTCTEKIDTVKNATVDLYVKGNVN